MSHSYTHLLIPTTYDYVPPAAAVTTFMHVIEALAVVPDPWDLWVLDRDGSSVLTTPARTIRVPGRKIPLDSVAEAEAHLDLANWDLRASGDGIPRRTLMPLGGIAPDFSDLTETLHVAVACHTRSSPVGMSDLHDAAVDAPNGFLPCTGADRSAFFSHPETLKLYEVAHAGTARFWVSIHHGNGLRPVIEDHFDVIPLALMREFEGILGVPLAQGGTWGN